MYAIRSYYERRVIRNLRREFRHGAGRQARAHQGEAARIDQEELAAQRPDGNRRARPVGSTCVQAGVGQSCSERAIGACTSGVITSYSIHYTKLYDAKPGSFRAGNRLPGCGQ